MDVCTYLDPILVAEGGTNVCLSNVVEKGTNVRLGILLEGRYACGTAPNGFARANECTVEPATVAEGDMYTGASTVAACKGCQIHSRVWLFHLLNEKLTYEKILCLLYHLP